MSLSIYVEEYDTMPSVLQNCQKLRTEFVSLRAWYWYFCSLNEKKNSYVADILLAKVAFWKIYKRCQTTNNPFMVLDNYLKIDENSSAIWESFLDFVSHFYKRLRMTKYSIINLGGIDTLLNILFLLSSRI